MGVRGYPTPPWRRPVKRWPMPHVPLIGALGTCELPDMPASRASMAEFCGESAIFIPNLSSEAHSERKGFFLPDLRTDTMNPAIHFEIPVEDTKKAADFYGKVLGWQVSEMGYGDVYLAAATTGSAGLFSTAPGAINGAIGLKGRVTPERLTIVVRVEDIGRTLEAVKEHGGKVFHEKNPVGYVGFTACFTGHEGNLIGLWQDSGN